MSQFDKSIKIPVNPDNPDSLACALERYTRLLQTGQAFKPAMGLQFDVEFIHSSNRRLQLADSGDKRALLESALALLRPDEPLTETITEDDVIYRSEAILFACALNFTELLPQLLQTAQAITAFSRHHNNTGDMVVDDMYIFGTEALFLLAQHHDDAILLLAQYLIPYWDNEHIHGPECMMAQLLELRGWDHQMIKAYLWCDNANLRRAFYADSDGSPTGLSLLNHLQQHPQDYPFFKQELKQRLLSEPVLAYHHSIEFSDETLVLDFFYSLECRWPVNAKPWNEDEWHDDIKLLPFMGRTLEDEALDLCQEIKALASQPLCRVALAHGEPRQHVPTEHEDNDDEWRENINDNDELPSLREQLYNQLEWLFDDDALDCDDLTAIDTLLNDSPDLLSYQDWPEHFGAYIYGCHRLLHLDSQSTESGALQTWLTNGLFPALVDILREGFKDREANSGNTQTGTLISLLTDVDSQANQNEINSALQQALINTDWSAFGGFSPQQAKYRLFNIDDGFQRGILSLFWLRLVAHRGQLSRPLDILSARWWQALISLAPQKMLRQITRLNSDYPQWSGIDDAAADNALQHDLEKVGFSSAQLQAFLIVSDRSLASYRPASGRFWQRYITQINTFAEGLQLAAENDTSMLGRHTINQQQALAEALLSIAEHHRIAFLADTAARHPQTNINLDADFQRALYANIEYNLASTWHVITKKINAKFGKKAVLFNDWHYERPTALELPLVLDANSNAQLRCQTDGQFPEYVTVLQRRGKQLFVLHHDPDDQHIVNGRLLTPILVVDEKVDHTELSAIIAENSDRNKRINHLLQQINAYLNGESDLSEVLPLFDAHCGERLNYGGRNDNQTGLDTFIWLLPQEKQQRLLTLLLSARRSSERLLHSEAIRNAYVRHLIRNGDLCIENRWQDDTVGHLTIRDCNASMALTRLSQNWVWQQLQPLPIPAERWVTLAFDWERQDLLNQLAKADVIPNMQAELTGAERLQLVKLISSEIGTGNTLQHLLKDKIRSVRDAVNALL
ncbi:hypothetical protein [Photobacterium nomapromontoriensis]|uniref:hypothetical protein n=1 Tax=Photobacterium nomapromontoriensis TaxID=2910237 RepID=UPI003D0C6089